MNQMMPLSMEGRFHFLLLLFTLVFIVCFLLDFIFVCVAAIDLPQGVHSMETSTGMAKNGTQTFHPLEHPTASSADAK